MSGLETYDALVGMVEDYLGRADLRMRVPTFVRLAETRLDRRLSLSEGEFGIALTVTGGATPLPDDYKAWRSVTAQSGGALEHVTPDQFYERWRGRWRQTDGRVGGWLTCGSRVAEFTVVSGPPVGDYDVPCDAWVFGLDNPFLLVGPAVTGDVRLVYQRGIPPLGTERPTNWLLQRFPDLYLYAALMEAAPFLKDDARVATWRSFLEEGIQDATDLDRNRRWGRGRFRLSGPTP